jgi:hypothetical protein
MRPRAGRIGPGDALRDKTARASVARRCDEIASSFVWYARIAGERVGTLRWVVNHGQIRQLVNDDLRLGLEDGHGERLRVEDVDQDRTRAELTKEFAIVRRTRRPPDRMAVGHEEGRKPAANDAGCARKKDPAHETPSARRRGLRRADIC